ncbi:MAG TPA: hypothetical protein VHO24_12925, partial [Opitutaceae bacterium]|nr:hypothetical protein [Opitutaceae bacterium]
VIPAELHAFQRALKIDAKKNRIHSDAGIFYPATVFSEIMQRDVSVILGCIGEASQANAAAMTMLVIKDFDPAMIILVGIAAGMRDKMKIGDVVVPREIADLSVSVATKGEKRPRPQVKPRMFAVKQMVAGFVLDQPNFHDQCEKTFGPPVVPEGKEKAFAAHVAFKPSVSDSTVASADMLLRDPDAFLELMDTHEGIRAAEMEAGGFVKACETGARPRLWLVVRGISDFGDELKDDCFHRLAASAAAVWTTCFLKDGLDFGSAPSSAAIVPPTPPPTAPVAPPPAATGPATIAFITSQFEKMAAAATGDRKKDLEEIRQAWRGGRDRNALTRVRELKARPDWDAVAPTVKAEYLRFEASLVLALERDAEGAKRLAHAAAQLDPQGNVETLEALVAYHENRTASAALPLLQNPRTIEGWNLRLALLAETQRWSEVLAETEQPPSNFMPNAETRRLRALALVFSDRLPEARTEIDGASTEQPDWFGVRYAAAIVDYYESLSPAVIAHVHKGWPDPIDLGFVRRDPAAVAALRRAETSFTKLLEAGGLDESTRRILEGWRLAALANDAERQTVAQQYCGDLVKAHPQHPIALTWANARGYPVDVNAGIEALFAALFP